MKGEIWEFVFPFFCHFWNENGWQLSWVASANYSSSKEETLLPALTMGWEGVRLILIWSQMDTCKRQSFPQKENTIFRQRDPFLRFFVTSIEKENEKSKNRIFLCLSYSVMKCVSFTYSFLLQSFVIILWNFTFKIFSPIVCKIIIGWNWQTIKWT